MPGRHFLHVPGPTNIPGRILNAMRVAMEDHRSAAFPKLALPLFEGLKKLFKTSTGTAFIFPATGTGAWEAVLVNTLSAGDRVLSSRFGQFSHLWIDLAPRRGLDVVVQQEADIPNLIVTPHVAWASREAMQILADQLTDNIEAFMAGTPRNVVV